MAVFETSGEQVIDVGDPIRGPMTSRERQRKDSRIIYLCPYEDTLNCPKTVRYADDEIYVREAAGCNLGPVIFKLNGDSVCRLVVDFSEPELNNSLRTLGNFIEFRNEEAPYD